MGKPLGTVSGLYRKRKRRVSVGKWILLIILFSVHSNLLIWTRFVTDLPPEPLDVVTGIEVRGVGVARARLAHSEANNLATTTGGRDIIVYLAQFGHHSSYGEQTDGRNSITGATKLNRSLATLYSNYVHRFPCDVMVFYGEDDNPSHDMLHTLQQGRPRLRFHQLNGTWWSLPHGLRVEDSGTWRQPGYSVGYRHMIQWYAVRIWPFLTKRGYTHVMRMDDDSYIQSAIQYNMFEYMRQHDKRYAFRQPCMEANVGKGLFELVDDYLNGLSPGMVDPKNLDAYRSNKILGFYNNFFIADMGFFMSPPASILLDVIEKSKKIYEQRTNDLIIQSLLVRLFLPPEQVLWIRDFTYEHTTLMGGAWKEKGCLQNGGISRGIGAHSDAEWKQIQDSYDGRFLHNPLCASKKAVRKAWHVGAGDIAQCEDPNGLCAKGLQQFSTKPPGFDERWNTVSWHSSVVGVHDGSAFHRSSECGGTGLNSGTIQQVAEWNVCWGPVARDISAGRCLIYSFGIAGDDPFTNFMALAGCQVYAFDPAQQHPRNYKPNVTFYPYGLVSGIADEHMYNHSHWGETGSGQYKTLLEIQRELGHSEVPISALKIDCEGCEWNLFADMDDHTLSRIGQILTEFHFTTTLRFDGNLAERYAQSCVENLDRHFDLFHFTKNDGAWYDRHIDEHVASAGIPTISPQEHTTKDGRRIVTNIAGCCVEMSLVNRATVNVE